METINLYTWQAFRDFVDNAELPVPVYWRGQRDPAWPLASRFERIILDIPVGRKKRASKVYPYDKRFTHGGNVWDYYEVFRDNYLERFQRAASGLRGPNPSHLDDDQWWALGRHYGLITPLLDWTEKPYIAAFFALSESYEQRPVGNYSPIAGKGVAIYRLVHDSKLEGDGLRVTKPIVDELVRLQGQRGVFTWLDSNKYYELQGFMDNTGRGNLLTQIILSDDAIVDGLIDLDKHGIDYRLLFPDLAGAI